jgi:hypothetical protein
MITNILEMLKHVEQYEHNEIIASAKGKYEYPNSYFKLFKKAIKWQSRK